ncbi:hypothetical protein ACVW0W_003127 [Bradyrhizobium sp. USDA 4469]
MSLGSGQGPFISENRRNTEIERVYRIRSASLRSSTIRRNLQNRCCWSPRRAETTNEMDQSSRRGRQMRILIYKRTHCGDPDPESGVFGNNDCMGRVRGWQYDAVIGIGGISPEARREGIAGKLTWVGIGPHKVFDNRNPHNPRVTFDHFWYEGERGPLLEMTYPALACRMYHKSARVLMHLRSKVSERQNALDLDRDINEILKLAKACPRSGQRGKRKLSPCMRRTTSHCNYHETKLAKTRTSRKC